METLLTVLGRALPARLAGPAQHVSGGLLLPAGNVTLLHPLGNTRFYRHGWHSWSPTRWLGLDVPPVTLQPPSRRPQADDPSHAEDCMHGGSGVGALRAPGDEVLLLGALGVGAWVSADENVLQGRCEGKPVEWFLTWGAEDQVFARYADLLGQRLGRMRKATGPVWCTWYSYYTQIWEQRILQTLTELRDLRFDVFQIDDGWQEDMGDWEANARFPSGMASVASRIRETNRRAGIWLAPFLVRPGSRLFRQHPDWLLRNEHGHLVVAAFNDFKPLYGLDTTHSGVEKWLRARIREVRSWGYDYLKLDYLYIGALPGRRKHNVPREQAYRHALSAMREEAGDAYVLACGAPILASLGLADGIRVGPDVAPYWEDESRVRLLHDASGPGAGSAIRTAVHRLWLQEVIQTDPDAVYFRTRYNLLDGSGKGWLKDLARVSGFITTSDPVEWLDPYEVEEMSAFLRTRPRVLRCGPYVYEVDGRKVDFSVLL